MKRVVSILLLVLILAACGNIYAPTWEITSQGEDAGFAATVLEKNWDTSRDRDFMILVRLNDSREVVQVYVNAQRYASINEDDVVYVKSK